MEICPKKSHINLLIQILGLGAHFMLFENFDEGCCLDTRILSMVSACRTQTMCSSILFLVALVKNRKHGICEKKLVKFYFPRPKSVISLLQMP